MKTLSKLGLMAKVLPPILVGTVVVLMAGAILIIEGVRGTSDLQIETARAALLTEQKIASDNQLEALTSKADSLGRFMSLTAPDLIMSYDFMALKEYQNIVARDEDVAYAAYLKPDGTPLTDFEKGGDGQVTEHRYPVESDGDLLGYVLLGMNHTRVDQEIAASNRRIGEAIDQVMENAHNSTDSFITIMALDVIGVLLVISFVTFVMLRKLVTDPLRDTTALMEELAAGNGDLTRRLPVPNDDEISRLCAAVNAFITRLQEMVGRIASEVDTLAEEAQALRRAGGDLSSHSETQRAETTRVATSMNEMTATVQEVARNADSAAESTREAEEQAREGKRMVAETSGSIQDLANEIENAANVIDEVENDSSDIGGVLDVIRGIAEQTNLLALNAAIEAARAGEQGRGFAVVADEVRMLASRTQTSTQEIQSMIEKLQSRTSQAVTVMQQSTDKTRQTVAMAKQAGDALEKIARAVTTINEMNTQIATAAREQSLVAEEINQNIDTINNISEGTAASAQQTAVSSDRLAQVAAELQGLVGVFRI